MLLSKEPQTDLPLDGHTRGRGTNCKYNKKCGFTIYIIVYGEALVYNESQ